MTVKMEKPRCLFPECEYVQQKYGEGDGGDWQCHFYPTPRFIDKYVGWCGQHTDFPEYLEGIKEITVNIGMKDSDLFDSLLGTNNIKMKRSAAGFFGGCVDEYNRHNGEKDKPTSND